MITFTWIISVHVSIKNYFKTHNYDIVDWMWMSGSIFEFQLGLPKYHKKEIISENGTIIEDLVVFRPLNVSKSIGKV